MPRVSVIIPAYNEERYVEACVASIVVQEVEGELEVIVADGRSTDRTRELAERAGARVVDNSERSIPAALNVALAAAQGEVIVRFDAHAEMPPGYVAACLRALEEEEGAVNVGGWREARGSSPWGKALAAALASPAGVGNARIWRRPPPAEGRRDVDTVPLGAWPAQALRDAGGWREDMLANEDFELNHRLRSAGGRVVFDPAIWSVYHPRESLEEIAQQYWRYGNWKAAMLADAPESVRPRQLAPLVLLALLASTPVARSARRGVGAYALALSLVAARSGAGWRLAPTLATMHVTWAAGVVRGLAGRARR
jgi:succinoglycan biosynthesis protein ExoA